MSEYDKYYNEFKRNKKSQQFYESGAWKKCRKLALIRDNYLCQSCLSKKIIRKAEVVHHIKELRDYPELGLTLTNLISWCNSCHEKHHKRRSGQGKKKVSQKINVVVINANREMI